MGNVLERAKQEQVIALGRLGWSLRRIEAATGVRRETAGGYLRSAGIARRRPGGWGRKPQVKAAIEVPPGSDSSKAAIEVITGFFCSTPADNSKPANEALRDPRDQRSGAGSEVLAKLCFPLIQVRLR